MYKAQADLGKTLIEVSGGLLMVECDLCTCSCTRALHMICICHVILTQDLISWFTGSTSIKTTTYSDFLWILNVINIKWGAYCNHNRVGRRITLVFLRDFIDPTRSAHHSADILHRQRLQRQTQEGEQGYMAPGSACINFPPRVAQLSEHYEI